MMMKHTKNLVIRPSTTPSTQGRKAFTNQINLPPTSIELLKEVAVGHGPTSVCQYKGSTYIGHKGGIVHRVDQAGNVVNNFIVHGNRWISGIAAF